ncbi:type IV pilin accessory protein [Acinetobacter indicus]|uniref:TfpX/TfpZ family type IV pilin accessory protein n=1 Tax=Acinetobacter indicus TaxID=756892 RepID=UPI00143FD554|nr:TfpX/TfpZ family type IV pilin accessory protein [Acinetobacter indicus]QIZ62799.1 type IV pilin accessory protein [Acinetobacter indicus]
MSKHLKFFLTHLSVSFLIGVIIVGIIFLVWYPAPFATAVGVTQIFLMLLIIDVIVGPLLGLLVYKEAKKTLKFDLTIILIIQFSALVYGFYSLEQGRPAWIVWHGDRFELVRKNDIILENIDQVQLEFQNVSWFGPQFTAVKPAVSADEQKEDIFKEVLGGISLAQQPERYVELNQVKKQIQQRALPLKELEQYNSQAEIENKIVKYSEANAWLPLKANAVDMVVLINKEAAEVIKIVDLRPWH